MEEKKSKLVLPEEVTVKIFVSGLSLRSLARFRSVCKRWKSIIDSDLFRDQYESLNSDSTLSWSITNNMNRTVLSLELVGHYGCERWGLTNSIGSWIMRYNNSNNDNPVRKASVLNSADGLVLVYTETLEGAPMYHVGNPLLQQWARIPLPPHLSGYDVVRLEENKLFSDSGLVTKTQKGVAVGYKVVWVLASCVVSRSFTCMIYSSETGLWMTQNVTCHRPMIWCSLQYSVPLNGVLHWLAASRSNLDPNYVVSYGGGDECRTIPFPSMPYFNLHQCFRRTITTSSGSVVYSNVFNNNGGRTIKVWKLVKYCDDDPAASWQLSWNLNTTNSCNLVGLGDNYFPVVMHPLNSDIIYLWCQNKNGLLLLNLRTHEFSLHREEPASEKKSMDGCSIRLSGCKEYMDSIYPSYNAARISGAHILYFSQYVFPSWLNPLPQLSS